MTPPTAAEILTSALALPPGERAGLVQSLIQSLPDGPRMFCTEAELAAEMNRRMLDIESGSGTTYLATETFRRAREALERSRP